MITKNFGQTLVGDCVNQMNQRFIVATLPGEWCRAAAVSVKHWDNLWKSRGGIVVNGAPREVPESTQWSP